METLGENKDKSHLPVVAMKALPPGHHGEGADAHDAGKGDAHGAQHDRGDNGNKSKPEEKEQKSPEMGRKIKWILIGAVVVVGIIGIIKYLHVRSDEKAREAELAAGPRVRTTKIVMSPGKHMITIDGETRPYNQATLYAKVSGYLKEIRVDKGDHVLAGQVLAVIESPETDQAYQAALAAAKNKQDIAARLRQLYKEDVISEQEAEQGITDSDVASATLHSEEVLKSYEVIKAPFEGTITARFADPGALVQNATNSQAAALPVVTISEIKRLKVDVFVDQRDASYIQKDADIEVTMAGRADVKIAGVVSRLSDQLDPQTKMLLVEIDIPNGDKKIVAGSFVEVRLPVNMPSYLEAPVESMVLKGNKPYLTMVMADDTLALKPIDVVNNDGKMLWIASGVAEGDLVALNVGDMIAEGAKIRPLDDKGKDLPAGPRTSAAPAPVNGTPAPGASPNAGGVAANGGNVSGQPPISAITPAPATTETVK